MKRILVIDDDRTFQSIMQASFDQSEYKTIPAFDGIEGMQRIEEFQPDLILLDILMPSMNGLQFLRKLNEKFGQGVVPVLITSNTDSMDNISEGVTLGIRGYIVKSNESMQNVVDTITKLVNEEKKQEVAGDLAGEAAAS